MSRHGEDKLQHHYLKPGELYLATEPTVISTLLGSCISVTMFHRRRRYGAICHGLLPNCSESTVCQCQKLCEKGARNMVCSINMMLSLFKDLGIRPTELEVKVFGGSDMFDVEGRAEKCKPTIGSQNSTISLQMLQKAGITISSSDIGGAQGRKIYFFSHTGVVLLKRLRKS